MADVEFDGFGNGPGVAERLRGAVPRVANLAGAAVSVALVLGMAYWGYKLAVRDVTGVPVVRALEGPMRVAPPEPGGVVSDHQGLAVNMVAAIGAASPPADRLVLAPRPVVLDDEDAAGTLVAQVAPVSGRATNAPGLMLGALPHSPEPDLQAADPDVTAAEESMSLIDALVASVVEAAQPLSGSQDGTAVVQQAAVMLPKGAMAKSPRPKARPNASSSANVATGTSSDAAQIVPVSAPAMVESDGTDQAPGTRLVQLGAFDSADAARAGWDKLAGKFGGLMAGKVRIVQAAQSGGRTFYRLRANGFAEDADQRRFCSALVAEQAACIPVTVK